MAINALPRLGLVLAAAVGLSGCGGGDGLRRATADDVEVALYFAIQRGDSRIVTSGAADAASLKRLYEITCREGTFGTWGCSVLLDDESRLSCTVDRVRLSGDDVEIDGRVHCKRD